MSSESLEDTVQIGRKSWMAAGFGILLIVALAAVAYYQSQRGNGAFGLGSLGSRGTVTTASGLQYEDLVVGDGEEVQAGTTISVHYTGWLEDDTKFDSSLDRDQPFTFMVGTSSVIPGWDEGVSGMRVGGKRRLIIPPDLAYGAEGAGGVIPPDAVLIFEVEVLRVLAAEIEQLLAGSGPEIQAGQIAVLDYTVWLDDGVQIDSSAESGQQIRFVVGGGQIIPGLDQGVRGMQVGEKRLVTIPPDLAFGAEGAGNVVPPNATLIFEIELAGIE